MLEENFVIEELEIMLYGCDEIVIVHSKTHGGLLHFYRKGYYSGELYIKCGFLLDELLQMADAMGVIHKTKIAALKTKLEALAEKAEV